MSAQELVWTDATLVEALDHHTGREIERGEYDGDQAEVYFTDGTAVRVGISVGGHCPTCRYTDLEIQIGRPK